MVPKKPPPTNTPGGCGNGALRAYSAPGTTFPVPFSGSPKSYARNLTYLYQQLTSLRPYDPGEPGGCLKKHLYAVGFSAQRELYPRAWKRSVFLLPALLAVGVGLTVINTRAVIEAIFGVRTAFVRTPKYAIDQNKSELDR